MMLSMESFLIRLWAPDEPELFGAPKDRAPALHGVIDAGPEGSARPFADQDELVVRLREALAERVRDRPQPPRTHKQAGRDPESKEFPPIRPGGG
jgi:hypothetical protein